MNNRVSWALTRFARRPADDPARPVPRARDDALICSHAEEWLAAWNAHDVEAITMCCADDAILVATSRSFRWGRRNRSLRGKSALRERFTRRLGLSPELMLTSEALFVTVGGYALLYRRENGQRALETVELDDNGHAVRITAFDELSPVENDFALARLLR